MSSVPTTSASSFNGKQFPQSFLSQEYEHEPADSQFQLILSAPKEQYTLISNAPIPTIKNHELLIRVSTVGLNPIDWKSPAYGYGIPSLPCILGRDFVGTVSSLSTSPSTESNHIQRRFVPGDIVASISTDYRDYRKAAFQEYAAASIFNVYRIPRHKSAHVHSLASLGVAFATSAIVLGVCLGLDFGNVEAGPDLFEIVRRLPQRAIPEDVVDECSDVKLRRNERLKPRDWLVVWGAGSTVGFLLVQLARLAGVKTVAIADMTRTGSVLLDAGADVLVHRKDPAQALEVTNSILAGKEVRFGIDCVGGDTADIVQNALGHTTDTTQRAHLVGLVSKPKTLKEGIQPHILPIKLFHECEEVGSSIVTWLEDLLQAEKLILPTVHVHPGTGLNHVNDALDKLRTRSFDGQRIVVPIRA